MLNPIGFVVALRTVILRRQTASERERQQWGWPSPEEIDVATFEAETVPADPLCYPQLPQLECQQPQPALEGLSSALQMPDEMETQVAPILPSTTMPLPAPPCCPAPLLTIPLPFPASMQYKKNIIAAKDEIQRGKKLAKGKKASSHDKQGKKESPKKQTKKSRNSDSTSQSASEDGKPRKPKRRQLKEVAEGEEQVAGEIIAVPAEEYQRVKRLVRVLSDGTEVLLPGGGQPVPPSPPLDGQPALVSDGEGVEEVSPAALKRIGQPPKALLDEEHVARPKRRGQRPKALHDDVLQSNAQGGRPSCSVHQQEEQIPASVSEPPRQAKQARTGSKAKDQVEPSKIACMQAPRDWRCRKNEDPSCERPLIRLKKSHKYFAYCSS